MSDVLHEINQRLFDGIKDIEVKSIKYYCAIQDILDKAFIDGLLSEQPDWQSPGSVLIKPASSIEKVDIEMIITVDGKLSKCS